MGVSEKKRQETEELKQRVLDSAEKIFVTEGIQHVTMRRIAASVDYAQTLLYRLFKNKNDLIDHLIARGYEGVRGQYDHVLAKEYLSSLETLEQILETYVEYALQHPNHYQMWFETSMLRFEEGDLILSHGRLQYVVFETWICWIKRSAEDGYFVGLKPLEVFQILWTRIHGLISLRLQHPSFCWLELEVHLKETLDLTKIGRA